MNQVLRKWLWAIAVTSLFNVLLHAESIPYRHKELPEIEKLDLSPLSIKPTFIQRYDQETFLVTGNDEEGAKFFVVKKKVDGVRLEYESSISPDVDYLGPVGFYEGDQWVILVDINVEYSGGVRVFIRQRDGGIKDIGVLDVGLPETSEDSMGPGSIIDAVKITKSKDALLFEFMEDVVVNPGKDSEKKMAKEKIKYVYSKGILSLESK